MLHGVTVVTVMIVPLYIKNPPAVGVAQATESLDFAGKGTRKPNLGGRRAGRLHTRQETRNLKLKAITDKSGPSRSGLRLTTRETLMPLGNLVRELALHYPFWRQMPPEQKAGVVAKIGTQFDLRSHMEFDCWPQIYAGIQQHMQKIYNGKKAALKERYWVPEEDGTYDLECIRRGRPSHIFEVIVNGDSVTPVALASTSAKGLIPPKTAEQKLAKKNELKAKSNHMLAISDELLLKFHACKDTFVSAASSKDQAFTASYADDVMFSFFTNESNAPQFDNEDLEKIDADDLEEMDLKWNVAMLTIRVKRFIKKTIRKLDLNVKEIVGFDRIKIECYNNHKRGHFSRECRAPRK
uniref:Ribonuclease H-like domain-containing protein n=1 Tax=Tanacetum cinerariifolium TaxID=118510 RepID=A0A6L2KX02_TANCI|nr:ribonuclease H-like domain-containing protein [Tanacetum cinerariifolium]